MSFLELSTSVPVKSPKDMVSDLRSAFYWEVVMFMCRDEYAKFAARRCVRVHCDEMLRQGLYSTLTKEQVNYWQQVKTLNDEYHD